MNYPFAYLHYDDCGGIAFYLSRRPEPYETMRANEALLINGSVAEPYTRVLCGNCGRVVCAPSRDAIVDVR